MSGNTAIVVENIKKVYNMGETKILALKDISFTIHEGEMVAIMGSSGSGKSTLLNILGCLDKPTAGSYYLYGENVSQLDKNQLAFIRNKRIGFVFQGFNLLGRMSVLANVELPLVYAGVPKKEMAERAKEALAWVGLSEYLHHYPNQMSGGQQQRVAIARALVNNPSLILADEPTGALDSKTSVEIMAVIQRLNIERGITVVVVTHEKDISLYCQRLINVKDGCITGDAPVLNQREAAGDLPVFPGEKEAAGWTF
ncbi:MAG: ABC transporter ATP-binding protein [Pelotomaculum sp.]|uniref:ABC-type antimicrobial peptide transport system, ATPase component n=1 Tax=Pelotomaculum thermopropionicum (strain DSM 13744 / JCM 10971 / SI) TaxID=370438 RepID=A5D6D0_PELTS|nr:ABC transporter ATP-binding protein [Pelotomaculum sp.]BAF58219.1 ABC-type antimicrobial peptide transport system, ATPase component [Pelotomaculum thermopropionicum SI]